MAHGRPARPDLMVRTLFQGEDAPVIWEPETVEATRLRQFTGACGQVVESFPAGGVRCLVIGLGERTSFSARAFRKAMAKAVRRLADTRCSSILWDIEESPENSILGQIAGECLGLAAWNFAVFRSPDPESMLVDVVVGSEDEAFDRGLQRGTALAVSVNWARSMAATPPNVATPNWMATQAETLAQLGLSFRKIEGAGLEAESMAGLINVGKASENPPCFIRVEYRPEGATGDPLVLLGKTITYDSGGLAIKPREGMKGMKGDKAGGCAVLGAMHAIATVIKPDFPVVGLLVAAENSISANAFRMDDVITFRNGLKVEVTNTDAEGRLVLADGLCWACDVESPRAIIDLATLTGGVVVALGSVFAGLFGNDETLNRALVACGEATGERVWRLPLDDEYRDVLKSEIADLVNSAASRGAHPVMGATFMSHFVKDGVPWSHIDIAGVSKSDSDKGPFVSGPTGFGVRLLADYVSRL